LLKIFGDDSGKVALYDLTTGLAEAIPPAAGAGPPPPCGEPLTLTANGDVVSFAKGTGKIGVAVGVWRGGTWHRDKATIASAVPTRVDLICNDQQLTAYNPGGAVLWTKPKTIRAPAEGDFSHTVGDITVVEVCPPGTPLGDPCPNVTTYGLATNAGKVLWQIPGFHRVFAIGGNYVLLEDSDPLKASGQEGWSIRQLATGQEVPGQHWTEPGTFAQGCCADNDFTANYGGLVVVHSGNEIRLWWPRSVAPARRDIQLITPPP
jgi:hypothetical protein